MAHLPIFIADARSIFGDPFRFRFAFPCSLTFDIFCASDPPSSPLTTCCATVFFSDSYKSCTQFAIYLQHQLQGFVFCSC